MAAKSGGELSVLFTWWIRPLGRMWKLFVWVWVTIIVGIGINGSSS